MKLPCNIIRDILPLYADGICSEESAEAVREHIEDCTDCGRQLEAMTAALPEKKAEAKKINPIRKIAVHYCKLVSVTVLCGLLIGTVFMQAVRLTANENDLNSVGQSWSTIKYRSEFASFGRLFRQGRYYEAMCMADLKNTPYISNFTAEDQDSNYKEYAKACQRFFKEHKIKSYSVKSYNSRSYIKAEVSFAVETPNSIPINIVYTFCKERRNKDGRFYIEKSEVLLDKSCDDTNTEMNKARTDLHNTKVHFPNFTYPDSWFAAHFKSYLEGDYFLNSAEDIITTERQQRAEHYFDPQNFDADKSLFYKSAPIKEGDKTQDILTELFIEKYTVESFDYTAPVFSDTLLFSGYTYNREGCFIQRFLITLNNGGERFSVKFSAPVTEIGNLILPVSELEFSDNAPEDFKEKFTGLFCG